MIVCPNHSADTKPYRLNMSTSEEDEKKEFTAVKPEPTAGAEEVVTGGAQSAVIVQKPVQAEPTTVKKQTVAKHTTTDTSALIGIVVGVIVLSFGMLLAFRELPYLPYPFSIIGLVLVAVALIAIGASLVSSRTAETLR